MATLRQEVSNIRTIFKWVNLDTRLTDRFLAAKLKAIALKFIKQSTDRRKLWNSPNLFTPINCLKMMQVPLSECCDYTSECTISRSIEPIPRIAEGTNFGMLIQSVRSVNFKGKRFIESSAERFANSLSLGLRTQQVHYWIQSTPDGYYLYTSDPDIEICTLVAYFEDDIPDSLLTCGEAPCCPTNPLDLEYKAPGYLSDDIQKELENQLLQIFNRRREDIQPNGRDENS